ncbi:MAG: hypothetical protein R6V06_04765 [Kiritimatiellia bacterium]
MHDAGTAGKHSQETPTTGGGLAPGAVSLEPVTDSGAVRSRHVIVYAGMPDKKGRDNAQRDKIKANFAGETNTTITTVGGKGPKDKWDKHGWKRGLQEAINEAAAAIEAAPDPSKEQFLLFVTDHGDLHNVEYVTTPIPSSNSVMVANVAAFVSADFQEQVFEYPGFSITVDIEPFTHEVGANPDEYVPFFPTNAWRLQLTPPPPSEPVLLTGFEERFIEWEDGIIGNAPEEGVRIFFPVDPTLFIDSFFDITYDVEIFNDTADMFEIMTFSQDTGPVAKRDMDGDLIHVVENTLIGENDMALDGHEIVVDGCTLTVDGVHVLDRLTLENNAVVTHSPGSIGMMLTVLNDVTVPSGSKIDVSAKGGLPLAETTGLSGGSFGGVGEQVDGTSAPVYGDALWPVYPGSGGSGELASSRGGGRVQLTAESLILQGGVYADGEIGATQTGGGGGGAILMNTKSVAGTGGLYANGGPADAGDGGGGRIALYAQTTGSFSPCALEAKSGGTGAGWGTVFMGVPRTVAVSCTGQGACDPMESVVIPYEGMEPFVFEPMPISLATNGTGVAVSYTFEWVNTGLWRGAMEDSVWLERLNNPDLLTASFNPLATEHAVMQPGGGMMFVVNGLSRWRYTLERRESLTEGEWLPVDGQIGILCNMTGPMVLTDLEITLPQAFYRVLSEAP